MENKYFGRAIGQEEDATAIATGENAVKGYEELMKMAENARDITTNFDRITASPEALAEWLDEHCDYCKEIQDVQCDKCPHAGRYCVHYNIWLEWLNEESIE